MRRNSPLFHKNRFDMNEMVPKSRRGQKIVLAVLAVALVVLLAFLLWPQSDGPGNEKHTTANLVGNQSGTAASSAAAQKVTPKKGKEKTAGYFKDAAFVGDDLVAALSKHSFWDGSTLFLATGKANPSNILREQLFTQNGQSVTALQALKNSGPKKVYICLGLNGVSWLSSEDMRSSIRDFVQRVQKELPKAQVYLLAIPTVDSATQQALPNFQNSKIQSYDELLLSLCEELEIYYLQPQGEELSQFVASVDTGTSQLQLSQQAVDAWLSTIRSYTAG